MKFLFRILPLFLLVIDSSTLLAQSHTVSGFVKEDETGESLWEPMFISRKI
ncbi:MAG: hypothetical protein IPG90_14820 [Bacteroidetes bacterium]|nr:hypothetical protein [Bacteroidota bacterium]